MTAGCFIQCFSRIASGKSGKEFCVRINSYSGRMNPARGVLGFSQELNRFSSVLWSLGRPPADVLGEAFGTNWQWWGLLRVGSAGIWKLVLRLCPGFACVEKPFSCSVRPPRCSASQVKVEHQTQVSHREDTARSVPVSCEGAGLSAGTVLKQAMCHFISRALEQGWYLSCLTASGEMHGNNYLEKPKFWGALCSEHIKLFFEAIPSPHLGRFYLVLLPTVCEGDTGLHVPRVCFTAQWGLLAAEEPPGNSREIYVFAVKR